MKFPIAIIFCLLIVQSATAQLSRKVERRLENRKYKDLGIVAYKMIRNHDMKGYYLKGEISYYQRRFGSAIISYRKSLKSDECRAMALYSIACSFAQEANNDSAVSYFEKYLESGHGAYAYDARQALSGMYFERGDLEQAEKYAAEMIRDDPSPKNYSWAGSLYRYDMKTDLACLMFFKAIVKGSAEDRRMYDDCNCGSWMETWIKKDGQLVSAPLKQ